MRRGNLHRAAWCLTSLSRTFASRKWWREALREVLDEVAGRSKDVIAVLPDAAARVMLLDFDTLPPNAREADGVVRFRLKKSLPF